MYPQEIEVWSFKFKSKNVLAMGFQSYSVIAFFLLETQTCRHVSFSPIFFPDHLSLTLLSSI